jgi:hypothetical protein
MRKLKTFLAIVICGAALFSACATSDAKTSEYVWENVTPKAAFPEGYGFPVFVMNGEMRALYGSGWTSKDGKNWTRAGLPSAGLNPGYQKYVQFKNAVYALGAVEGNYLNFRVRTKIARTRDFRSWETVAEKSNLPERIFYGALAFKDKIWLFGGWDGARYYNDVWNSEDGVVWKRVAETAAWSPRTAGGVVFKDKIWLIGGGVIDGDKADNPHAHREVWTSADGVDRYFERQRRGFRRPFVARRREPQRRRFFQRRARLGRRHRLAKAIRPVVAARRGGGLGFRRPAVYDRRQILLSRKRQSALRLQQ